MAKDRSNRPLANWGGVRPPAEAKPQPKPQARAVETLPAKSTSPAASSAALRKWRKEEGAEPGQNNGKLVLPLTNTMQELLTFGRKQMAQLGPWEQKFVASLDQFALKHHGLTEAQYKKLQEVLAR